MSEDFSIPEKELARIGSVYKRSGCDKVCRILGCNNECVHYPIRLKYLVEQAVR